MDDRVITAAVAVADTLLAKQAGLRDHSVTTLELLELIEAHNRAVNAYRLLVES